MRYGIIAKSLGALLLILAVGALGPLGADAIAGFDTWPWWIMLLLTAATGGGLFVLGRRASPDDMGMREGIAVTALVWLAGSLLGGVGVWLSVWHASFIDGWFEAMSGFTTTGATTFGHDRPIEAVSPGTKLWRSQMQWIGGIGIVVISLALLPLLIGGSGVKAFRAEVPGLDADRLAPRIRDTAFILYRFYLALTLAVFLGLVACGVGGFDAICHAMTTVATGGFSTHDNSIEGLGSAAAEWVIIAGMLVAGCNFGLLLHAVHGRPSRLLLSGEFRLYLALVIGGGLAMAILVGNGTGFYEGRLHDLVRDSLFNVVSVTTSTGYAVGFDAHPQGWDAWPAASQLILVLLMIGGGCAGSTAGGVKLVRFLVAWRAARRELRRYMEPARVTPVRLGGHQLKEPVVLQVGTFLFLYFVSWAVGSLIFAALGSDLATATSTAISCLSNIGPALGDIGPADSWDAVGPTAHVVGIFLMLLGRLELLGVILMLRLRHWRR